MPIKAESHICKFYDDPDDVTVNGSVTGIISQSINYNARLSAMGDWSFTISQAEYDSTFITPGCYVRFYSVFSSTEYLEFSGYLLDLEPTWNKPSQGPNLITLRGKDDFWELAEETVQFGEIYDLIDMQPIYVGVQKGNFGSGDSTTLPNVYDSNAGTSETFGLKQIDDASDTQNAFFYVGNDSPFNRADFDLGATTNDTAIQVNLQVHQIGQDFTGWGSPASVVDTTSTGAAEVGSGSPIKLWKFDGYVRWTKQQYEAMTNHDGYSLYWMRIYSSLNDLDTIDMNEVTVKAAAASTTDVTSVVNEFLPQDGGGSPLWSLNASSETATQENFVVTAYNDSALAILDDLSERSGECFSLSGERELWWIDPDSPPSTGVTAESDTTNRGNTAYCSITSLRRKTSYKEKIKRIYARGAGSDDVAAVTLSDLTPIPGGSSYRFNVPLGYTVFVDSDDPNASYIDNGNITDGKTVWIEFPTIAPTRGGTGRNRNVADELAKSAISYLKRNADNSVYYNATVVGLDDDANTIICGSTITVQAEITAQDGTATETINTALPIISYRKYFDRDGIKYFDLKLGTIAKPEPTRQYNEATKRRKKEQRARHPQAASGSKLYWGNPGGSVGSGSPGTGGVDTHAVLGVSHTTNAMADGSVVGADGTGAQPVEITFNATDFDFNTSTNDYTVDVTGLIGNGLTESAGDIDIGTPTTLTTSTTNSVTASSHAHEITTTADGKTNVSTILQSDGSGDLTISGLTADDVSITGAAGTNRDLIYQTAGVSRFILRTNDTAEGGSDAGSDFQIVPRDDSGAALPPALTITRSTGEVTLLLLTVGNGAGAEYIAIDGGAGSVRDLEFLTNGTTRWNLRCDDTAEAGSDAGSDFRIVPRDDSGTSLGAALIITRADGNANFTANLDVDGDLIVGDGAGSQTITIDGGAATNRAIRYETNDSLRWVARASSTAEAGSDAGSDYEIAGYDDTGTLIGTYFRITRSNGVITIPTTSGGLVVGSPTGLAKGAGTINAQAVYDDDTLLTDFVFEPEYELIPIAAMERYFIENKHLPTIDGREVWEREGRFSLGKIVSQLWETVEVQARYIAELNNRLEKLENASTD